MKNIIKKAERLVNKKIALAGSVSKDGSPGIKAMLIGRREVLKIFYFASNLSATRTAEYRENPKACLYFYNRILYKGVMLDGTMEILTDEQSRKMLWKRSLRNAYPTGRVDDPDYCVLKFTATKGRYYYMFRTESFDI